MSTGAPLAILTFIAYFLLRALVVVGPAMLFVARSRFAKARRVYRRAFSEGQLRSELRAGLITIAFDGVLVGVLRATGSVPLGDPGVLESLLQSGALLFIFGVGAFWPISLKVIAGYFLLNYGLFTVVLDRAFGTAWDDYPEVQRRAAMGEGLTTLGTRALMNRPGTEPSPADVCS